MLTLLFMSILSLTFEIQPVKALTIGANFTFTSDIYEPIVVIADNIIIDGAGYTVQGPGNGTGISLNGRNNVTLKNVEVKNFTYGIYLSYSTNNTVAGNTVSNNALYGIRLYSSSNNTIIGNNASSNNDEGIRLSWHSENNNISGNTASSNGYEGIYLVLSSNNTVTGNTASNNTYGIYLSSSSNNTVTGNNASSNNDWGICLWTSSNNTVLTGNNASSNYGAGIYLNSNSNNTISGNTASNNYGGIILYSSSNNTVIGNTASNNEAGIIITHSSNNNTIIGNTASSNNEVGIRLAMTSGNNVLFHNNLINNTVQASVTTGYVNTWNDGYPSGGNYWSSYTGVDLDYDGIGDTAYTINANNIDNYPLMGMFSDFNATSEYHVQTICNSSISDFQYNGTAICFNVTGENDTTGFCRICVPRALMNETYQVFVNGTEVQCNLLPCSNTTHSYLYFTYNLSTQEVIIIPEFPAFLILPLFMAATLLAAIIIRRKHKANLRIPA